MAADLKPVLDTLERTPAILEQMVGAMPVETCRWRPAEARWSVVQVLEHLIDVESLALGRRARRIVEEDGPFLENFDQVSAAEAGAGVDEATPQELLARFREARAGNLEWIRGLSPDSLERTGTHEEIGEISLWSHLNQWAFHDLGHIRQIAELHRAHLFYPNTGNYHKYYSVAP